MKTKSELVDLISKFDLAPLGETLAESARRSLQLVPGEAFDSESNPMGSRFGGLPYVPEEFAWPMSGPAIDPKNLGYEPHQYVEGPLRFIVQINLKELPYLPVHLPDTGVLTVFAANHKVDFPQTECATEDWRLVLTQPGRGELCRPPKPSPEFIEILDYYWDSPIGNDSILSPCWAVNFEEFWQHDQRLLIGSPNFPDELDLDLKRGMSVHLFGGLPRPLQWPPENTAGKYRRLSPEEMACVCQFDTDYRLGLRWAGEGRAYFFAPEKDGMLDLDRSVLVTQQ